MAQALHVFARGAPAQAERHAAVGQGVGDLADAAQGLGAPDAKRGGDMVIAHTAQHYGAVSGETGIEDAASVFMASQEGVHLVDQQGGRPQLNGTEQGGRGDIGDL
ncbi:hypothetical protein D3C81_1709100 [compost metagenome]